TSLARQKRNSSRHRHDARAWNSSWSLRDSLAYRRGWDGDIYLAADTELERTLALKILPEEFAADPSRMRRFVQEARAASALNHPNILTIYEIKQEGPIPFIATEFIDGITLRKKIAKGRMGLMDALDTA